MDHSLERKGAKAQRREDAEKECIIQLFAPSRLCVKKKFGYSVFWFVLAILKEVFKPAEGDHGADRGAERRE